ncbi:MAG: hypothetical protein ACYTXC_07865 [Nostoc sp.]
MQKLTHFTLQPTPKKRSLFTVRTSPFKVTQKISDFLSALRQLLQVGEPAQRTGNSIASAV